MKPHRWVHQERGYQCRDCSTFARVGEDGELVIRHTADKREVGQSVYVKVPMECTPGKRLDVMRGGAPR